MVKGFSEPTGMSGVLYSIEFFVYEKLEVQKCTRTDISERWHPCRYCKSSTYQKYKKSGGALDGEITLVDDAAVYKNMSGNETGYGFYRFIAVKPKKLVIASNGAWGKDGLISSPSVLNNKDAVFECDLSDMILSKHLAVRLFLVVYCHYADWRNSNACVKSVWGGKNNC